MKIIFYDQFLRLFVLLFMFIDKHENCKKINVYLLTEIGCCIDKHQTIY